jgi:ATP-dependent Lon protease
MTGELTVTGKVLPIGGVKEKTIAAKKAKVKTIIFPVENKKDFDELPDYIKKGLDVHFVNYFDEVLDIVF